MPFTPSQRAILREQDPYFGGKFIVHSILVLFGTIALILVGATHNLSNFFLRPMVIWLALLMAWILFLWVYIMLRRKLVHPGWRVGLDLIFWLSGSLVPIPLMVVAASGMPYSDGTPPESSFSNRFHKGSTMSFHKYYRLLVAASVFMALLYILLLVEWIWACVDCSRHNRRVRDLEVARISNAIVKDDEHRHPEKSIVDNTQPIGRYDGNNSVRSFRSSVDTVTAGYGSQSREHITDNYIL